MATKKWLNIILLTLSCFTSHFVYAQSPFGQVISINTYYKWMYAPADWLLIIRDDESGIVTPYLFSFVSPSNNWIAFSYGRTLRVTVSELTFGPFAKIKNFCGLEDGILTNTSIYITITGVLSPDPNSSFCNIRYFKNTPFTIVSGT